MTPSRPLSLRGLFILAAALLAATVWAGDPVPDVDVILEQIPGGVAAECSSDCRFDSWEVEVGKDLAGALSPALLPDGWSFEAEGKRVRLSGPPLDRPVRFRFEAGDARRPDRISYRLSLEGRTLLERKNVSVTPVPPREVIRSLQGVVQMPTQVAAGEPMRLKVVDPSLQAAGGTWSLSGVVTDEEEPEEESNEPEEASRRVALVVPDGASDAVPDEALSDIARALLAQGAPAGSFEVVPLLEGDPLLDDETLEVWTVARSAASQSTKPASEVVTGVKQVMQQQVEIAPRPPAGASTVTRARHDVAMSVIQNIGREIASPPAGGGGLGVYAVRPTGVGEAGVPVIVVTGIAIGEEDMPVEDSPPAAIINTTRSNIKSVPAAIQGADTARMAGAGKVLSFDLSGPPARGDLPVLVGGDEAEGSSATAFAQTNPDGTVDFELPADLAPGASLALTLTDRFGELVFDVPSVPGVQVVEPRGDGEARITAATPRSFAGQSVCVCGSFPGPPAWDGLLLDGQAAGSPASASGRMVWVDLPAGLAPGAHVFTGAAAAGFPASDRATTLVLEVGGEIDSTKLQRLESTPMRLWVVGTEEPVELRVRNLTPAIIALEGGDDQVIRTSGGSPNQLQRTVRGLAPGAFNINYELAGAPCPCEAQSYY